MCYVPSLPFSAQAYLALALRQHFAQPVVWVLDSPHALDEAFHDLDALAGVHQPRILFFPACEPSASAGAAPHPDVIGDRFLTLLALANCQPTAEPVLVATCIQALLQHVPPPSSLRETRLEIAVGDEYEIDALCERLATLGFRAEIEVGSKGQFARRGGILDVWPVTELWPLRIELEGPSVVSIRRFDPGTQRSIEKIHRCHLVPAREKYGFAEGLGASLLDYLEASTLWIWSEPESLHHHAEMYRSMLPVIEGTPAACPDFQQIRSKARSQCCSGEVVIGLDRAMQGPSLPLGLREAEMVGTVPGASVTNDLLERERRRILEKLKADRQSGKEVYLFFPTEGARNRFCEVHPEAASFHTRVAALSTGFSYPDAGVEVVSEADLYGVRKRIPGRYELHGKGRTPSVLPGERLTSWSDIQPGELVVHVDHGIGKYLGLYEIELDGRMQEVLAIEYANRARLYVPVSQSHLLTRYVGVGRYRPELHALGGRRWKREKAAAEKAIQDFAATLLETQARRETQPGHAFGPDTPWQHEFEAAFPFQETPDQARATDEVKADMESPRPMDRLVCGDVGYGKTEIAMRAAFKAVLDGFQVAVLVPTTVLAQQHYDTFTERMAAFPITIEMLSRFRSKQEQAEIVRRLAEGSIDIVIGTHRLLQPDVKFAKLGLVVIDEEQRFGVAHKEHFKRLRATVDILTLTATPIPRTLYMSLTGVKDLSIIQTPPQDRLPVETIVAPYSDELVRRAILQELNRGGQVYYLHNRVQTIDLVYLHLRRLVPEARIAMAHGQMKERDLANIMHAFVRGQYDVLLCTTIIESGVDIPNVNTILIDRADRFGMAELYQLRGRVGRYKNRAYAYLLLPKHGQLFYNARRRISAIQSHSTLGAGFRLALRDLEIRGAGNLLGPEQSGHIAAVGFELYCQLLRRTIAQLKNEPLPPIIDVPLRLEFVELTSAHGYESAAAAIPTNYVEDEALRVSLYRRIAALATEEEVNQMEQELRDRFGPIPEPLYRLLLIMRLRIRAHHRKMQEIEVREDKVMIKRSGDYIMVGGRFPRLKAKDVTARLEELLKWVSKL